jgi:hypothetical protein
VANLRLTNTVDTSEALFEAIGIPGQVVVHHEVCTLKVDALAGCISREQDLDVRIVQEALLCLAAFFAAHSTVD